MKSLRVAVALAVTLFVSVGCSDRATDTRVMVLALDGLDPDAVEILAGEGKLPNISKLRRAGASGRLESMRPMLSPILWTTVATGRLPVNHGIGHFVAVNTVTKVETPVTSRMRRVKALWNIVSDFGLTTSVVGWWATWPAENVRGAIVSDHAAYHFLFDTGFEEIGSEDLTGLVSPAEILPEVLPLLRRPSDVTFAELLEFAAIPRAEFDQPFDFDDDVAQLRWIISSSASYAAVGKHLWSREKPALSMVYIEATDSASHLFGHLFRQAPLAGSLAAQQQRFGTTVEMIYRRADAIVGEYLDLVGEDGVLIVLSDHGFQLGRLHADPSSSDELRRVDASAHEEEGVLYLYGKGVRSGVQIDSAGLLDVAPTILQLLHLPIASDMPGRVLHEVFATPQKEAHVPTFERTAAPGANEAEASAADSAILEHLRSLGYLDTTSPSGETNLAASAFEARNYAEAVRAFRDLIADHPEDAGLRASLAGSLGAMGRYEAALEALDEAERMDPRRPEIFHNRAVIYERQNRTADAVSEYSRALRCSPDYQPSSDALRRLTGSASPRVPANPEERDALVLAHAAQLLAQRGDYETAWGKIQEAAAVAPNHILVLQYQANIAYLRGDNESARRALEKAVQLEPDNVLLRGNLENLPPPR